MYIRLKYSITPLRGLIGMARHPDIQKIQITGLFFKISYFGSFKGKQISTKNCFSLHVYLRTSKIHNSIYVFDKWEKNLSHKKCRTIRVRKCLSDGPSRPEK